MYTSPPSLSITCIAMDNVRKILKDRHLSVNGLLTLIDPQQASRLWHAIQQFAQACLP